MSELTEGERRLWQAVIVQAMADATSQAKDMRLEKRRARDWLTTPSANFNAVCSLAGLEPGRVRIQAREAIDRADANGPRRPSTRPGGRSQLPETLGDRRGELRARSARIGDFTTP